MKLNDEDMRLLLYCGLYTYMCIVILYRVPNRELHSFLQFISFVFLPILKYIMYNFDLNLNFRVFIP